MSTENLIRQRVLYTGHVQGVGFRATCVRLSGNCAVSGWVRNLPDGRVELEAQGAAAEVAGLRAAISAHFRGNIREEHATDCPVAPGERGFRIRE